jgi:hypothetical protein
MIDVIMQHDSVRGPVLLPRTRAPHHGNGNAYPSSQVGLGPYTHAYSCNVTLIVCVFGHAGESDPNLHAVREQC